MSVSILFHTLTSVASEWLLWSEGSSPMSVRQSGLGYRKLMSLRTLPSTKLALACLLRGRHQNQHHLVRRPSWIWCACRRGGEYHKHNTTRTKLCWSWLRKQSAPRGNALPRELCCYLLLLCSLALKKARTNAENETFSAHCTQPRNVLRRRGFEVCARTLRDLMTELAKLKPILSNISIIRWKLHYTRQETNYMHCWGPDLSSIRGCNRKRQV